MIEDDSEQYATIDPIFSSWARDHSFKIDTEYKGYTVRSIAVPGIPNREPFGQEAQLWVDEPDKEGMITVSVAVGRWSSKERIWPSDLRTTLEQQYAFLKAKGQHGN